MNKKVIQNEQLPLLVIVGPTASGKSSLAMRIAQEFHGELICADSRTIYKGMDIGTAKPSLEDQAIVPHWGLDVVEPGERFTAADFKFLAQQMIAEIRGRGHIPIIVGGTGLYVDGVIFDYDFVETNPKLRAKLEVMSLEELQEYCKNNNILLPENHQNRRYVIRAIERENVSSKRLAAPIDNCIVVGINTESGVLRKRIEERAEQLFENGMVEEAKKLGKKYGWKSEAMTGNVYRYIADMTEEGRVPLPSDAVDKMATKDRQLAKRQLTWLRRHVWIYWGNQRDVRDYIEAALGRAGVVE